MAPPVVEGSSHLSQFCDPITESVQDSWPFVDAEFASVIAPVHSRLSSGELEPKDAADTFAALLTAHLERFELPSANCPSSPPTSLVHRSRKIEKVVDTMRSMMPHYRRNRKSAPKPFFNACRVFSRALKAKRNLEAGRSTRSQERSFRSNPWHFAKKCCNGRRTLEEPDFTAETAFNHFKDATSGNHLSYSSLPDWVSEVMPAPSSEDLVDFDLSPITPGIVKSTLKKRPSGSAPGDDGISYHHLKKLPSTHHFLATLFSKILLENHTAPKTWCQAKVKLIPKGGDASEPGTVPEGERNNRNQPPKRVPLQHQWDYGAHFCYLIHRTKCLAPWITSLSHFLGSQKCLWVCVSPTNS